MIQKLFGAPKLHWYEVRYIYLLGRKAIFEFTAQIGLKEQSTVLNRREVKKVVGPLHLLRGGELKNSLKNGLLNAETICYLGFFANKK